MRTRTALILVLAFLMAGCGTGPSTSSTAVDAEETALPAGPHQSAAQAIFPSGPAPDGCVRPPPDVTSIIEQTDPLACYGGADLTIDALVASPGTFSCPGVLQPTWFDCWHLVALNPIPGTSVKPEFLLVARSLPGESLFAVLHPDIEALRPRVMDTAVRLTGHYGDPAAQDCVYTSYPDPGPPPADEVVDMCRATFVITAMEPLES